MSFSQPWSACAKTPPFVNLSTIKSVFITVFHTISQATAKGSLPLSPLMSLAQNKGETVHNQRVSMHSPWFSKFILFISVYAGITTHLLIPMKEDHTQHHLIVIG